MANALGHRRNAGQPSNGWHRDCQVAATAISGEGKSVELSNILPLRREGRKLSWSNEGAPARGTILTPCLFDRVQARTQNLYLRSFKIVLGFQAIVFGLELLNGFDEHPRIGLTSTPIELVRRREQRCISC